MSVGRKKDKHKDVSSGLEFVVLSNCINMNYLTCL